MSGLGFELMTKSVTLNPSGAAGLARVATHAAAAVDGGDRRRPNVARVGRRQHGAVVLAQLVVKADNLAGRRRAVHGVVVGAEGEDSRAAASVGLGGDRRLIGPPAYSAVVSGAHKS